MFFLHYHVSVRNTVEQAILQKKSLHKLAVLEISSRCE